MITKGEGDCCGCTACLQVCPRNAISMQENEKGFLSPTINKTKCVDCGLCENVCRFEKRIRDRLPEGNPQIYGLKKRQGRLRSQSGGAFAAFAETVLYSGGIVYGVTAEKKEIYYVRIESIEGLPSLKGSKYVQASMKNVLMEVRQDLEDNKRVLFSGTPCHIDGLYAFLEEKKISVKKLLTCDLICHGTPSPRVFRDYYDYLTRRFSMVEHFNFRKKFGGEWHSHIESFKEKGKYLITSTNYVDIFYSHLELRESCYNCPYSSTNRISDITIGDFWGIEKVNLSYDDGDGVSLVFANSQKGKNFIPEIVSKAKIRKYRLEDCIQPNLLHPTEKPEMYEKFWKSYFEKGFEHTVKHYCGFSSENYTKKTFVQHLKREIKRFGRKVKRLLKSK